jgi:hypothetical protein
MCWERVGVLTVKVGETKEEVARINLSEVKGIR